MPRGIGRYDEAQVQRQLWTPSCLGASRVSFWFDAAQFGVICDGSGNVQTLRDLSGNGNNATQATSGNRPAWAPVRFNGRPALALTGSPLTYFNMPTLANVDPTIYIAFENVNTGNYRIFASGSLNANTPAYGMANTNQLVMGRSAIANDVVVSTVSTGFHISSARFAALSGTGNVPVLTLDGAITTASMTATTYNGPADQMFADRNSASMHGAVGEYLLFAGRHTDREMRIIEGYLAWKWGTVDKLAASHPFKNRPPLIGD